MFETRAGLKAAMQKICREDPSLRSHHTGDDGMFVLSGMGELHIEVVADRLKKEFKLDVYVGPIQVAYREQPTEEVGHVGMCQIFVVDRFSKFTSLVITFNYHLVR